MKFKENENFLNDVVESQAGIDNMDNFLVTNIIETAGKTLKKKKNKHNKTRVNRWFNKSLNDMKCELNKLAKKIKNDKNNHTIGLYFTLKKKFKKAAKSAKSTYKQGLMDKIASMENTNPKLFWKLIKDLKARNNNDNPIPLDIWEMYFKNLGYEKQKNKSNFDRNIQTLADQLLNNNTAKILELDKEITEIELRSHINKLKTGKAEGADRISNELIKYGCDTLLPFLLKLFNSIIKTETVPMSWGVGLICPIHKSGDRSDPNNYRGITSSNNISKLFNRILNERLVKYLQKKKILSEEQIGFKRGARTSDHMFVLKTIIDYHKYRKLAVFTCFIDLKKAFDTVWRTGMMFKLLKAGISSKFVSIVKDLYKKTKNMVLVKGYISNPFETYLGTRQGCNLSPTIFNMYLNDLCQVLRMRNCDPVKMGDKNLNSLMYADDIILFSNTKEGLQKSLNTCHQYFKTWKLQVNIKKTKVMVFNSSNKTIQSFHYGSENIEVVNKYKYLGIILSNKGSFKLAVEDLLVKAKKAYAAIYQSLNIYNGAKPKIILKAIDMMVFPILTYGCEVWAPFIYKHSLDDLLRNVRDKMEKFHTRICKNTLGVARRTTDIACRSELGRYPIIINIICNTYSYYLRMQYAETNSLLGQACLTQKSLHLSKQKNLYSFIEHICYITQHPRQPAAPGRILTKGMAKTMTKN